MNDAVVSRRTGTLWADIEEDKTNTISMPKAIMIGLLIEIVVIAGIFSIDFDSRIKKKEQIMKVSRVKEPEPKKLEEPKKIEEPQPVPKEIKKIVREQPLPKQEQPVSKPETAPIPMDAPAPGPGSATGPSIPTAVGPSSPAVGTGKPSGDGGIRKGIVPISKVEPTYPREAQREGIEGSVVARVTISEAGAVTNVEIVSANPKRIFDREVKRALMQWKFKPDASQYIGEIEIDFKLKDQ